MDNTFVDMGSEFLAHHGVDGQKWGVRNGPPYPLNDDGQEQLGLQKDIQNNRFSDEELYAALEKIKAAQSGKNVSPSKDNALTAEQRKWAKNPSLMLKNFDKFTPEQLRVAMDMERNYREIKNRKVDNAMVTKRWVDLGAGYMQSFANAGRSIGSIMDTITKMKYKQFGLTLNDSYEEGIARDHLKKYSGKKDATKNKTINLDLLEQLENGDISIDEYVRKTKGDS